MPATNSRRRPSRSAARPARSRNPPNISVYALRIQERFCSENPRSILIVGSATLTTVVSRMTMNWAIATTASTALGLSRETRPLAGRAGALASMVFSLKRLLVSSHHRIQAIELPTAIAGRHPLCGLLCSSQATSEQRAGADDPQPDGDGEAEHRVLWACASVECDSGADHGDRQPYEERDEQIRCHRQPVLRRGGFEHEAGRSFEEGSRARADQGATGQKQREARSECARRSRAARDRAAWRSCRASARARPAGGPLTAEPQRPRRTPGTASRRTMRAKDGAAWQPGRARPDPRRVHSPRRLQGWLLPPGPQCLPNVTESSPDSQLWQLL